MPIITPNRPLEDNPKHHKYSQYVHTAAHQSLTLSPRSGKHRAQYSSITQTAVYCMTPQDGVPTHYVPLCTQYYLLTQLWRLVRTAPYARACLYTLLYIYFTKPISPFWKILGSFAQLLKCFVCWLNWLGFFSWFYLVVTSSSEFLSFWLGFCTNMFCFRFLRGWNDYAIFDVVKMIRITCSKFLFMQEINQFHPALCN